MPVSSRARAAPAPTASSSPPRAVAPEAKLGARPRVQLTAAAGTLHGGGLCYNVRVSMVVYNRISVPNVGQRLLAYSCSRDDPWGLQL